VKREGVAVWCKRGHPSIAHAALKSTGNGSQLEPICNAMRFKKFEAFGRLAFAHFHAFNIEVLQKGCGRNLHKRHSYNNLQIQLSVKTLKKRQGNQS
jgi:hypothetical protein